MLSRRGLLGLGAAGLSGLAGLSGCSSAAPAPASGRVGHPGPRRVRYGPHPVQYGDLYLPAGEPRATVVVVHGGFWLSQYALDLGAATSADLADRGYAAWNVEYRRLGNGGGWPTTMTDVAAAVDHVAELPGVDPRRVVTLGHSAGGHLAVWAATRDRGPRVPGVPASSGVEVVGAVAQSGVLDLRTAAAQHLGGDVVLQLLGGPPDAVPTRYAAADPTERAALAVDAGVKVRCVVGEDDTTVPAAQSEAYLAAARAAGAGADLAGLARVPGDHFALIDPSTPAWSGVLAAVGDVAG